MSRLGESIRDNLIVGEHYRTEEVILASGQNLKRGAVLGKVRYATPTTGTLAGTGNGTCTVVKPGRNMRVGSYTATASSVTATAATFSVASPSGLTLGSVTVGLGTNDYADFASDEISFRVTNGSTDFDATSVFTVAVTGYVPTSASVTGTGNGTMPQVEARSQAKRGAYLATCSVAATHGGTFSVTDPSGNVVGTAYTSKRSGTGTGALTEIKAGPRFKNTGAYLITCTAAATNGGTFSVTNPDGDVIGSFSLPGTSTGSATFWHEEISFKLTDATDFVLADVITLYWFESEHLAFVIWDGSTDFIVGDYFTATVAVAEEECKLVNRENVDGSQFPYAVLGDDCDASSAAKRSIGYISGSFDERSLAFGGNETVEDYRRDMVTIGIFPVATSKALVQ